ncbi:MAG: cytochrome c oxidase subunit II [Actinomycetota bacterium]|nr:cytochrome c oxidase subunit II [Actinomycetota bacterium]
MPEGRGDSPVRKHHSIVPMVVFGVGATVIGIWIVLAIHWFPTDASRQAHRIRVLYDVLLIASVPIFVLVITVIGFSVWYYRMRPGEELMDGPPIHGNTKLEVIWTIAPAILIVGLVAYSVSVLYANEAKKGNEITIDVTARQWAFEYAYVEPGKKAVYSPYLYLPNGHPILFHIRSLDVIHSFFVPQFSEKIDAVPGITTDLRVTPTKRGGYPVECTELCGAGHSFMRSTTYVLPPALFETWMKKQPVQALTTSGIPPGSVLPVAVSGVPNPLPFLTAPAPTISSAPSSAPAAPSSAPAAPSSAPAASSTTSTTPSSAGTGGNAVAGKALFIGAGGCGSCHTLAAAGTSGTIGPNLTAQLKTDCANPASQKVRGTTLTACIDKAITDPYAYLPSGFSAGIMPSNFAQTLGTSKVNDLVAFLVSVTK